MNLKTKHSGRLRREEKKKKKTKKMKMILQEALLTHLHVQQQAEYSRVSKQCQIFYVCDQ